MCGDDLIGSIPGIPKITIGGDAEDASKKLKVAGQKHVLAGGASGGIEKKEGNAEKVSNYEKDRGFFFMKAYGWDREKKNEHLNAEGKQLKAAKTGQLFKAGGEFSKKFNEKQASGHDYDRNYDRGPSLYEQGAFAKRMGYTKPPSYESPRLDGYKYIQPEVEYSEGSYEMIQPKTNYYPNKEYTRIHYPISGSYVPEMNYKNGYDTYKNSKKYPIKKLWNQGYYSNKYVSKPITDDNHIENNLIEYYGNERSKYEPIHVTPDSHDDASYPMNYSGDKYSDDDEDEGKHYYDRKMTDYDIDKLRSSYSKYNDDYAGSQLLPQKIHIESSSLESSSLDQPVTKQYRLWSGSHYY